MQIMRWSVYYAVMVRAAVVGASGYAGAELLAILAEHPDMVVTSAVANSCAGQPIAQVHPRLRGAYPTEDFGALEEFNPAAVDLVFLALPHGQSAQVASQIGAGTRVVDLGADFRLESTHAWQTYYGGEHAGTWVYGLADVPQFAQEVVTATRVANPGCYATALSLSMAPVVASGLVDADALVAVAASGTSGAGRSSDVSLSATEIMGSVRAYKTGGAHQHTPEVEQSLSKVSGRSVRLSFTPLLVPMPRGIHATVSAPLHGTAEQVRAAYVNFFLGSPFVTVLPAGQQGRTADVLGTNNAVLSVECDVHANRVVVTCVIDNLVKGAAGQAVQNANLMLGLPMTAGLPGNMALGALT